MAVDFAAPRHVRLVLAFLAFSLWSAGRARRGCAAATSAATGRGAVGAEVGSAGRAWQSRQMRQPPPSSRLPPDSTTKQTAGASRAHARLHGDRGFDPSVRRQGRAAGRHRLYRLSAGWRRSAQPSGDLLLQRRAGGGLRLSAIRRCRTLAAADRRRRGGFLRIARSCAQCRDLARLHRSRLHRSRRDRL